jgi:hypothetical protein
MLYLTSYSLIGYGLSNTFNGIVNNDKDGIKTSIITIFFGFGLLRQITRYSDKKEEQSNELIKIIGKYYVTPFLLSLVVIAPAFAIINKSNNDFTA